MAGKCHDCKNRHHCLRSVPNDDVLCPHWQLGKCFLCKYISADNEAWYQRGCETWCCGGCRKFKRDWKKTFRIIRGLF